MSFWVYYIYFWENKSIFDDDSKTESLSEEIYLKEGIECAKFHEKCGENSPLNNILRIYKF